MMPNLVFLARQLGGEIASGAISCPGPGHSKHDRSLRVFIDPSAPHGFRVHSYADGWRGCRKYVQQIICGVTPAFAPHESRAAHLKRDEITRIKWAMNVWAEGQPIRNSLVVTYLVARLRTIDENLLNGEVIRFHPACPFKLKDDRLIRTPAMLALMRDVLTDIPKAVHRTALKSDGTDKGVMPDGTNTKKMLGVAKGCAVKLDANETVATGLAIAEGIETGLSARLLGMRPTWAMGCANGIASFPVLSGITALTLCEEDDKTGANRAAIAQCAERWIRDGKEVFTANPTEGGDMNDALKRLHDR